MPRKEQPRRKPTQAARKARAMIISRSRRKKNIVGVDQGTVIRIDRRTSTIQFQTESGEGGKTFARDFPTWRLRTIAADFFGAKVKHEMFWLGPDMPDMIVSRLSRIGPTISLKTIRPSRRLTAQDYALLDRDSPAEDDEE
jgi:hypothetical protein